MIRRRLLRQEHVLHGDIHDPARATSTRRATTVAWPVSVGAHHKHWPRYHKYRASTALGHDAIAAVARSHAYGVEERPQERVAVDVHEHRRPRLLETGHVARAVVDDALLR